MIRQDSAQLYVSKCYVLNDILYLPHYTSPGVYVKPGYQDGMRIQTGGSVEEKDLPQAGATIKVEMLWHRGYMHGPERNK